ncbi:cobalamin biosynthesis protein [Alkalimonas sp.]|uniref:cobalamin biosynthesis protein n=1 Tax=Alkalimonas sp. TaxID=1872453 RepID=UPI00263AA262|nr:cobalamin biosynthesis protein [Alkalimonas sp.]MCC5825450.1 cobalamin biosynthesis protein [Alkalimonas sp.]
MPWLEQLQTSPAMLWLVLLLAVLLPLPASYHPLTFFRFFAQKLAQKVNPDPKRSISQLRLSGTLALLLALLPFLALLYTSNWLMAWPELYQLLLLYLCLDFAAIRQRIIRLQQALKAQQLNLARDLASRVLLRQTRSLSSLGLSKAGIESLWLQFAQVWLNTLFWYLVGGIWLAVAVRLLLILQQEWSTKLSHNRHFGAPASWLAHYLLWPGYWLCFLLVCIRLRCRESFRQLQRAPKNTFNLAQSACLASACASLGCRLGGPAVYEAERKNVRDKLATDYPEPDPRHLLKALQAQQQVLHLVLLMIGMGVAAWYLLFWYH